MNKTLINLKNKNYLYLKKQTKNWMNFFYLLLITEANDVLFTL